MVARNFGITRLCLQVLFIERALDIALVTDPIARLEAAVDSSVEWLQKRHHTSGYRDNTIFYSSRILDSAILTCVHY
jgi:hypothetical protein